MIPFCARGMSFVLLMSLVAGAATASSWTTHTDASHVSGLAVRGNDLWAGTSGGVLHWDLPAGTYEKFTASEGLADQWVKEVLIDSHGDRWFGTVEGVQRFDGVSWTTYDTSNSPLPHNTVYALVEDLTGVIWFGTAFGCARFDGVAWEVFTDLGGGATSVAVRGIDVDSHNRIWTANNPDDYGDPGGVSMYDGSTWSRFDPDPDAIGQYFLSLAVDGNDNVWAGSWTNWAFMFDGGTWTHFDDGNSGLVGNNIEAIEVQNGTVVWIANHESYGTPTTQGAARYDGGSWATYTPANSGLPNSFIYALAATSDAVYFGTSCHGCASFDGSQWDYYETIDEPHSNWLTSIVEGSIGSGDSLLYFGTDHSGVAIFDGDGWSSYTSENSGLGDDYVNDLHLSGGTLWIGSQFSGVWRFDGLAWQNYHAGNSDLLGDIILSVDSDSYGTLWFGTAGWDGPSGQDGAVARFDGVTWTNYYLSNSGLIDDDGLQVAVDQEDTIWIGTEEGVSAFDGLSTWTNYHSGNSGLVDDRVQAITFDAANGKWFATLGGVSHLSGETWTSYTMADGLPSNAIRDIGVSPSGVAWIATSGGAASLMEGQGWTTYIQGDGIADDDVTAVHIQDENAIWFGTGRSGISLLGEDAASVRDPEPRPAARFLVQCYPNPCNAATTIRYDLPAPGYVQISVYDATGRRVAQLLDRRESRCGEVRWLGTDDSGHPLSSGLYFYRLTADEHTLQRRVVLIQ